MEVGGSEGGEGMERDERGEEREGGAADTLVFDSSGGHHLRGKGALMGILSSRQAQASAPSSPAAINRGKYASLDQAEANFTSYSS